MGIRQGLTAAEESKLKVLIDKGASWESVVERCALVDERGREQTPLFADVDLKTVKKNIFDPLVKKHEEAKKAGKTGILAHERAEADKKAAAAKKAKEDAER